MGLELIGGFEYLGTSGGGGGGGSYLPLSGGTLTGSIVPPNNAYALESPTRSIGFAFWDGWPAIKSGAAFTSSWGSGGYTLASNMYIGWSSTTTGGEAWSDTRAYRASAGIVDWRYSTTAQGARWYNTYTDASNYERVSLTWNSNVLSLKSEAAGTGTKRKVHLPGCFLLASASDVSPAVGTSGTEQDLTTVTIAAGTLATNGDKLILQSNAEFSSTDTTFDGTWHLDVAGSELISTANVPSTPNPNDNGNVTVYVEIVRASTTQLRIRGWWIYYNVTTNINECVAVQKNQTVTDIDSNSFDIVSRGTPDGGTTDVIQKTMDVQLITQ